MFLKIFEKLRRFGVKSLSDFELFTLITGSENPEKHEFLSLINDGLEDYPESALRKKYAVAYLCASELTRRNFLAYGQKITCSSEALRYFYKYASKNKIYFFTITLNELGEVIKRRVLDADMHGGVSSCFENVFVESILDRARFIISARNSPSGRLEPIMEEIRIIRRIQDAGKIIGVELLDYIVFSSIGHVSIMEWVLSYPVMK